MTITAGARSDGATRFQAAFDTVAAAIGKAVLGKKHTIRPTLTSLLSEGPMLG